MGTAAEDAGDMMEAGSYRDRVTIQTRTAASGTFGSTVSEWATTETRWCRRAPVSAQYAMVLAQRGHTQRVERLFFRGELTVDIANTRFVIDGRNYRAIEPPEVETQKRMSTVLISQAVERT